jgi:hypothetical protein
MKTFLFASLHASSRRASVQRFGNCGMTRFLQVPSTWDSAGWEGKHVRRYRSTSGILVFIPCRKRLRTLASILSTTEKPPSSLPIKETPPFTCKRVGLAMVLSTGITTRMSFLQMNDSKYCFNPHDLRKEPKVGYTVDLFWRFAALIFRDTPYQN